LRDELLPEDIKTLLEECQEKIDALEVDLVALGVGNQEPSPTIVNRLFRGFHSIKGAAAYLKHDPLLQLGHATESVLAEVRDEDLQLSQAHVQLLLSTADRMRQMVAGGEPRKDVQFSKELERLNAVLHPTVKPANAEAAKPGKRNAASATQFRPLKVLVVEDDFSSRLVLQGLLSKYGECHIAVNGREAVEAFRAARESGCGYDLICMDVHMPEMDGREAVEQIRAIEENAGIYLDRVKIFMTTAIRDMKTVVASFKAICDAYLIKPIDGENLAEHLTSFRLIGRRQNLPTKQELAIH
jgi:two-component system chemotaxis response regulator CheY